MFSSCQARPRHLLVLRLLPLHAWPSGYLVLHPHLPHPFTSPPFSILTHTHQHRTLLTLPPHGPTPVKKGHPSCSWRRRPRNGRCLWGPGLLRLHLLGSPLLPPLRSISRSFVLLLSDVGFWGAAGRSGVEFLLPAPRPDPRFFWGIFPFPGALTLSGFVGPLIASDCLGYPSAREFAPLPFSSVLIHPSTSLHGPVVFWTCARGGWPRWPNPHFPSPLVS